MRRWKRNPHLLRSKFSLRARSPRAKRKGEERETLDPPSSIQSGAAGSSFPLLPFFSPRSALSIQEFKDENCKGVSIIISALVGQMRGTLEDFQNEFRLMHTRAWETKSTGCPDSFSSDPGLRSPFSGSDKIVWGLPFSVYSQLIFDLLILSRCYQCLAVKPSFRKNWT